MQLTATARLAFVPFWSVASWGAACRTRTKNGFCFFSCAARLGGIAGSRRVRARVLSGAVENTLLPLSNSVRPQVWSPRHWDNCESVSQSQLTVLTAGVVTDTWADVFHCECDSFVRVCINTNTIACINVNTTIATSWLQLRRCVNCKCLGKLCSAATLQMKIEYRVVLS